MTKIEMEDRIQEIKTAIEQSIANHNALLGRLAEAQHQLGILFEREIQQEKEKEDAVS